MPRRRDANTFLLIIGTVAAFAILTSTMSKSPALPLLAQNLGATSAEIGLIGAISPIPGILVSSIAGAYSDRNGRQRILLYSLIIFATAPFGYLFVTAAWQLIIIRFYHGFATAVFMPVAMAAVADRFPSSVRGEKLGTYSSFTMVGRGIAPFLGGSLMFWFGFQSVYLTCGITAVIALGLFFLIPWGEPASVVRAKKFEGSMLSALSNVVKDRHIMITSSMEGVQYFAVGAFETFVPIYASTVGYNDFQIGIIVGLQVVSMLIAKPFMGRVSDREGRAPSIVIGLLVGAVAIALIPYVADFAILSLLSIGFGVTVATVTASTSALVCEIAGTSAHGSAIGVLSSVMDIGHSSGPLVTGALVGAVSFALGFGTAAVLLVVGAIVFALTVWRQMRKQKTVVKCEPTEHQD
ncbi:MAG TPA: MFS transporter [Methanomassiliicoccales archaeon]|nr:MFS transporter [Methanomassiliicoccales archaeon]